MESFPPALAAPAALHELVVLSCAGGAAVWAFDFLPLDPTSPATAARLLAGLAVPARARCRQLRGVPRARCRLVGPSVGEDPLAEAVAFQEAWGGELRLGARDCRTHVAALAAALTGR
jgi:hypothetical protein